MLQGFVDRQPPRFPELERTYSLSHAATIALVALLALGGYLTLDRAIATGQSSSTAIARTERELQLSQRVASLIAQTALGNPTLKPDLRRSIDELERTHWSLVAGIPSAGIRSAITDPQLKAIYFEGGSALDAAATEFITRARRINAAPNLAPAQAAQMAPLFLAAQVPLLDGLTAAVRVRQARAEHDMRLLRWVGLGICTSLLAMLLAANLLVFRPMARRIWQLVREVHEATRLLTIDPLTGTLNKSSFQARGAIEIQKARRYQRPISLLMINADELSAIEEQHGTDGGETVLKALTSSFFAGTRISDLVARVNAEQFAILLPETNCAGAELLAERLRRKISDLSVPINDKTISCTVSIGVAAAEKDASFLWPTLKRADEALYEAKMRGRNQVVVAA